MVLLCDISTYKNVATVSQWMILPNGTPMRKAFVESVRTYESQWMILPNGTPIARATLLVQKA